MLNQANRNKNDFVFCFEYLRPVNACAIDDTGTSFFSTSSYIGGFTKLWHWCRIHQWIYSLLTVSIRLRSNMGNLNRKESVVFLRLIFFDGAQSIFSNFMLILTAAVFGLYWCPLASPAVRLGLRAFVVEIGHQKHRACNGISNIMMSEI